MAGSLGRPELLGWAARIEVRALHETFIGWIAYLLSPIQTFECRCPCSYILMCNICSGSIKPGSCKFSQLQGSFVSRAPLSLSFSYLFREGKKVC